MDIQQLLDVLWVIMASSLVFFMQAGFSMVESGLTRSKNSINVAVKNLTDLGVSILIFWAIGFALMFGNSFRGISGMSNWFFRFSDTTLMVPAAFFLFQAMFCSTSATIVSGAVAERMRYASYIISTILLSGIIYPVFGHWVWGGAGGGSIGLGAGWLASIGFVDFAGSSVVHSVGGWVGLAILLIIGPRTGRFSEDGTSRPIPGSSIPMAVGGVIILWFGWIGFNGGSTLVMDGSVPGIIMRTCLAASAGMVGALAAGWIFKKTPDVGFVLNGALAGLVAITAPVHAVNEMESVIIGAVGGLVMLLCTELLEKLKIDDAVGAIPVHLAAGIWGTLAVGIFGDPEILGTEPLWGAQFLVQLIGAGACGLWSFLMAWIILNIINRISPLRVSTEDEHKGLNVAEHGASTETYQLFQVMEEQARTGDLSLRVPVEPFTEIGQIAERYNSALAGFEENSVARSDYQTILDNVSDGLFLIDSGGAISPNYSAATEEIFCREDLAGVRLEELIKPMLTEKDFKAFSDYLPLLFDPKMKTRTLDRLNPLSESPFYLDTGKGDFTTRHLKFRFSRIASEGKITHLMILVNDCTAEKEIAQSLEAERRKNQGEMEMFYSILHLQPDLFREFLKSAEEDLDRVNETLEHEEGGLVQRLEKIFRHVHSVKGNASLLELDFMAQRAHDFEDAVQELQEKENLQNDDFLSLTVMLSEMYGVLDQIRKLMERLSNFRENMVKHDQMGGELIALSLQKLARKTAEDLGKKVEFRFQDFRSRDIPPAYRKPLKDLMIQLVRNAVSHGIEEEKLRILNGKTPVGRLEIKSRLDEGVLTLTVRDDGRGLDFFKLRERSVQLFPENPPEDKKSLFLSMFQSGVSTSDEVDKHSGRGVGMALVKTIAEELKGKLVVKTQENRFCEFNLLIPLEGSL